MSDSSAIGREPRVNPPAPAPSTTPLTRMGSWGALIALTGLLGFELPPLYREFHALQIDEAQARDGTIMDWVDIHPVKSEAAPPDPFFENEPDALRLWSGWSTTEHQHQWFRIPPGQIDPHRLFLAFDRDTIRPIDHPRLESRGETRWKLLPESAGIISVDDGARRRAYPAQVLAKVVIVNDTVDGRPMVLIHTPFVAESRTYRIYDPILDGHRLAFGVSGYFLDRQPLLFDRETESLWAARDDRLESIAGTYRGKALAVIARPTTVPWGAWSSSNPDGRLVVGADRQSSTD